MRKIDNADCKNENKFHPDYLPFVDGKESFLSAVLSGADADDYTYEALKLFLLGAPRLSAVQV